MAENGGSGTPVDFTTTILTTTTTNVEAVQLPTDELPVVVRSASKREIDVLLVPFNKTINTRQGMEEYAPGSLAGLAPDSLLLQGLEHGAAIGLGQDGTPKVVRIPAGRSTRVWEDDAAGYATFRVARTQAGDEMLALAEDGVIRGVSLEINDPSKNVVERVKRSGRTVTRVMRAALTGAALTYRPAYAEATITAIRSQEDAVSDQESTPAEFTQEAQNALVAQMAASFKQPMDAIMDRLSAIEQRDRQDIELPGVTRTIEDERPDKGLWAHTILRALSGDVIPKEQMRTLDPIITSDNLGVVPPAYLTELIGVIDASRPFLATTRRLALPASGLDIKVPRIDQRPEVDVQSGEKQDIASQTTKIGLVTYSAVTIAGGADISIQLLKRSSPEFLSLFIELLAEQYAIVSEDQAITALADAMGGFGDATAMDPEDLNLGDAYVASFDAIRRGPDTIWLSTKAVGEFIDAKADTTNQPLYPGLTPSATAAGGISGTISGLRPVHVPTLDAHGAYAIVGPSTGFAWTEDGTYTLQVDVPSKAGRDVAIVGLLWSMPWYPDAFTAYNVAS